METRRRATLIGAGAVFLWGTLALLTTLTGDVPPFQMVAITFGVAFLIALIKWIMRGESIPRHFRQPPRAWALGTFGLFGYHFLIFTALKTAPPVEANLVNYLWPLLIVFFSALLPGEKLRARHIAGTLLGLAGVYLLVTGGTSIRPDAEHLPGYAAAFLAALVWSSYSVASSRLGHVPTDAVGAFCLLAGILSAAAHLVFETTVYPSFNEWLALILLGLGPAGGAFFLWDWGLKRGSVRALGGIAYCAPLLSTTLLIAFGPGSLTLAVAIAAGAIVIGAALAAGDAFGR
ncbi:MAG: DMT family transporter [Alphaproteobacteria bacterium]